MLLHLTNIIWETWETTFHGGARSQPLRSEEEASIIRKASCAGASLHVGGRGGLALRLMKLRALPLQVPVQDLEGLSMQSRGHMFYEIYKLRHFSCSG